MSRALAIAQTLMLRGMVAWQSDVLSLVLNLFWLLLALLAAWAIGERWGAVPIAMAGTALVLASFGQALGLFAFSN